jgi:hypothetical protein
MTIAALTTCGMLFTVVFRAGEMRMLMARLIAVGLS